jgi:ankyrin repeat protein
LLIESGANPNASGSDGKTPFHIQVDGFNPAAPQPYKFLDFFYSKGADVNQIAASGTPLMTAAGRSPQLVKYLLDHGARVDLANGQATTALHVAAEQRQSEVVEMLLAANAKVDPMDWRGTTPLHLAVRARCLECARALISHGADVNVEIEGGLTPLLAAEDLHDEPMQDLIKRHGGRVNYAYIAKRAAIRQLFDSSFRGMH